MSLALGGIWVTSNYVLDGASLRPLVISKEALVATAITLVLSGAAMVFRRKQPPKFLITLVIAFFGISTLLDIQSTGNLGSPYLSLWMIVALFGAVAGAASFLPVCIITIVYGLYLFVYQQMAIADWIVYGLVIAIPIIIGLFIWGYRFQLQDKSSQTVSKLANELDRESNKSEIITNAIADGMILIDSEGVVQIINPAARRIIGWGEEDATGLDYRSVLKIIDSSNNVVEGPLDPIQQCLSTHQSVLTDKLGIRTVSGKQLLASIMASPISDSGSGTVVVFRDITAQRAEEREQAEFISTASHEMRTPVAAIEGYLGLALNPQTATIDDKARTYLVKAQESAKHLGRLFQDLLDISRIEDGRLKNNPSMIDIPSYVRDLLGDFTSQFTEKGLNVVYGPDAHASGQTVAPLLYSNADPDHLHETLSNLITNAIKYTKEGTVTVDVNADDDHVYISVKDTGIGIPAEDLPHLFQKFYRVDNSDTREIGGTGLGLYLARRLSEAMGGHLNVQSTYGEGSTFTVDLPRVPRETAEQAQQPQEAAATQTAQ